MKKIIYTIFITVLVLLSCSEADEFLDVTPRGIRIPRTVEDFDLMLNDGSIIHLMDIENFVYMDPDVTTKFFQNNAYFWEDEIYSGEQQDFALVRLYRNLFSANLIINNIDDAPLGGAPEDLRLKVKGAALAERASNNFILVNYYSPHYHPETAATDLSAPLVLEASLENDAKNATVKEMYDQILKDLLEAEDIVDASANLPLFASKASREGVYGLLSKVYLYMGDFEKAFDYADKCLAISNFIYDINDIEPDPDWGHIAPPRNYYNNKENIWFKTVHGIGNFNPWYDLGYAPHLQDIFDKDNDFRYKNYQIDEGNGYVGVKFWIFPDTNLLVSVPDMLLIRAECYAHAGNIDAAMTDINMLRENRFDRANFADDDAFKAAIYLTAVDKDEALKLISEERRRETFTSGMNFLDLKRYHAQGRSIPTFTRDTGTGIVTLEPGSTKYYVAIAPEFLSRSDNMVSNK